MQQCLGWHWKLYPWLSSADGKIFSCRPQLGTFPWSLPAILKLFTLLVTLFLKCLFVFTLLLNQITFSRFNCCLISFIFNSVHILPLLLFQSESHSFLLWLCGRLLLTPTNSAVERKPGHFHSFGRAVNSLIPLQSYEYIFLFKIWFLSWRAWIWLGIFFVRERRDV